MRHIAFAMSVCIYIRMYVCPYVCIYVCMYISMYVCPYVYIYVCMYIRMYVYTYVCMDAVWLEKLLVPGDFDKVLLDPPLFSGPYRSL